MMMMMMMMMMINRQLKGIIWPFWAKSDRLSALNSREAGDVRESRLGFGCQLVLSAIISGAVSTNAPGDPAPVPHLAAAHRRAEHRAAPAPPNKPHSRTLRGHGRVAKVEKRPFVSGGTNVAGSYRTPVTCVSSRDPDQSHTRTQTRT